MANKKKRRLPNVTPNDLNACASVYTLYLMACSPSTVNLAKKLIAKNNIPIFPCRKLYERIPKKYHLFFDQMRPAIFENFLLIARASYGSTNESNIESTLLQHYIKTSKEYQANSPVGEEKDVFEAICKNKEKLSPECVIRYSLSYLARGLTKDEDARKELIKNISGLSHYMSIPTYGFTDWNELADNSPVFDCLTRVWKPASDEFYDKGFYCMSILEHRTEFIDAIENTLTRHGINTNDFYKEQLTQKEIKQAISDTFGAFTINLDVLDELDEGLQELSDEDDDTFFDNASKKLDYYSDKIGETTPLLIYAIALETVAKMYSSARDTANKCLKDALDASVVYDKEQKRNVTKEHKLAEAKQKEKDKSLAEEKQKQLNHLQSKYEALQSKYDDAMEENRFLRSMLEHEDEPQDADVEENVEPAIDFPEDAILIGGHPNWQRKFNQKHPKVRILSGVDPTFDENILRRNVAVILNSRHMKHSVFYKVRRCQQRLGFKIIYIE